MSDDAPSNPTIAILIPTYNRADFFQQALESALAQDYPHLRIIVSDNASTDSTPSLRERYRQDPRLRWYRNDSNIGLASNWRKLLYEYADCDYVKILADDDYLTNRQHVSQAVAAIQNNGALIVFAGAGSYDDVDHSLVDRSWDLPESLTPAWWMQHIGDRENGKTLFPNLTTLAVFNLAKAKALQAFIDPVFGMDYQLALELMLAGPSAYLKGIHGVERKHDRNDGFNAHLDVVLSSLQLYERVLRFGLEQGFSEHALREFARRFMFVIIRGFIIYTWSRERGSSLKSAFTLYRTLEKVDRQLARNVMRSPQTLIRFFMGGSPKRQEFLRRAYYRFCLLRERLRGKKSSTRA